MASTVGKDVELSRNEGTIFEKWEEINLKDDLLRGIYRFGLHTPSFIQKKSILPILMGKDLRAQAQSGTGKTAAFSVGALQILDSDVEGAQVLVLATTREIALQNAECMRNLSAFMKGVEVGCLLGGTSVQESIETLNRSPSIVVGTPGRVHHMIKDRYLSCRNIKLLIIDEADQMLKQGFIEQVKVIFDYLNKDILQIAMFSATWEKEDLEICDAILKKDHCVIDIKDEDQTLKGITQYYVDLSYNHEAKNRNLLDDLKINALVDIYSSVSIGKSVIFANDINRVNFIHEAMKVRGFPCEVSHSGLTQTERNAAIKKFSSGECRALISSDLLGRGMDVQDLSVVFNFDVPTDETTYIHRIGRAGRYGRRGIAISFIGTGQEKSWLDRVEKHYRTTVKALPKDFAMVFPDAAK